ncbi:C-type lectin domain family 4 member F-like isoform X2 [Alosa alosa]|uniref:C-type lectin domain family 4 member F-like isoform X2 n=1 Tax=Alosa alosa TaxID=278164 RepID=UPI0020150963|nr:C-type lectin domain family 4 member F-like isoform X2 [Alosa alosa]
METDEVTYSDITIIKTENANQKGNNRDEEGANVIYSQVNVLKNANDLDPASDSKHDPANSSKSYSEKESPACTSPRSTALLLSICVLLLAVAVTMGGLYIMKEEKYSGMKQNLETLNMQYKNISNEKKDVETRLSGVKEQLDTLRMEHTNVTLALNATQANMSEITEIMEMLQEQYVNATSMTSSLQANLTETKRMLADQKNKNDNLTKEITKLMAELPVRCADAWEYHNGSCYYFSSDMKNWTDSKDACVTMGGHLVIINSATEMDILRNKGEFWIGLSQAQPGGRWYWVDNTNLITSRFWHTNQPDNGGEDIGVYGRRMCHGFFVRGWNDNSCSKSLKRICESKSCRG